MEHNIFTSNALGGKIALVTGGSTGIGRKIAIDLALGGAKVVICGRNKENLAETVAHIASLGGASFAYPADVTSGAEVTTMCKDIATKHGTVDILVNCAGGSARERSSLFVDSQENIWDYVIDLNYKSVLLVTHAVLPEMIRAGSGRIINISSLDGVIGASGRADYSGAKAAVLGFSKALAKEVAAHHITVNCVSPGPIVSGYDEIMLNNDSPEAAIWSQKMTEVTGFGYGQKSDISSIVTFIASDVSKFMSGQNISVCGLADSNMNW